MVRKQTYCLACEKELEGRRDKKFYDAHCKSTFYHKKVQEDDISFHVRVDKQLKMNRRFLKNYKKSCKAIIGSEELQQQGFDHNFFTHYWKNRQGDVYLFVYEFGFLTKMENGRKKYILVTWQPYMKKSNFT